MHHLSKVMMDGFKRWLKTGTIALLLTLSLGLSAAANRDYGLPAGNAITDGRALLRYALPIENEPVRKLQTSLEDISTQLRAKRRWGGVTSDISTAERIVNRQSDLLASVAEAKQPEAEALIAQLKEGLATMRAATEAKDKEQIWIKRTEMLNLVGQLEALMVGEYPFEVPEQYSYLPQLKGRATVEVVTDKGKITLVADGYNAPVTAGNFVDLVQRGFYDGLEFIRSEESYVLQAGDPPGPEVGFIDPTSKKYRNVPLEILVRGDQEPTYGITLEQAGRYRDQPVLPFSAYGAVAMARPETEVDGGSSQFFFFLFEPELTPAGLNLLDGRYAVFGYVIEGKEVLEKLSAGDKILSAKVIQGGENLVQPQA
ncbi:peptidylprolyl isomerase [Microcoleus sp. FACHB-68]|uniref:peptidylprolyl isomerase n=1 Tax=Microcoleus sp. FACHB-68 TaxID=2692826 RepID=UPI0016892947|nr:peptidylprolyl isomerase [Microcoleus sp. FACHB-68]MBD1938019.1 peptidylprolyl isomerase [Microcoleus sp. FACHB-68]